MNDQPNTRDVQPSTTWVIHYRQTEYRKIVVEADSRDEARAKWARGEGGDEFVATGDDQTIISMEADVILSPAAIAELAYLEQDLSNSKLSKAEVENLREVWRGHAERIRDGLVSDDELLANQASRERYSKMTYEEAVAELDADHEAKS